MTLVGITAYFTLPLASAGLAGIALDIIIEWIAVKFALLFFDRVSDILKWAGKKLRKLVNWLLGRQEAIYKSLVEIECAKQLQKLDQAWDHHIQSIETIFSGSNLDNSQDYLMRCCMNAVLAGVPENEVCETAEAAKKYLESMCEKEFRL